jgi:hypothetical protein
VNVTHLILGGLGILAVFTIAIVPIIGGLLHAHRERQLTHLERMRALETGQQLPGDAAAARIKAASGPLAESSDRAALARKCYSTALWVAFWGFITATSHGSIGIHTGVAQLIAASVGVIGVTAVICGTILAVRVPVAGQPASAACSKPPIDADAYDVVSSRG